MIPNRNNWQFKNINNLDTNINLEDTYTIELTDLLDMLIEMIKYKGLPESINQSQFEKYLILDGAIGLMNINNTWYFTRVSFVENQALSKDYTPTQAFIHNIYISQNLGKGTGPFEIGKDIYIIRNTKFYTSDYIRLSLYALMLAQSDLSLNDTVFKFRINNFFSAEDSTDVESINNLFNEIYKGNKKMAIVSDNFVNKEKIKQYSLINQSPKDIIELRNYIRASALLGISLNANNNMKRESLGENETAVNYDSLTPYIDNKLECRKEDFKKINGLDVTVELNSSWRDLMKSIEIYIQNNDLLNNDDLKLDSKKINDTEKDDEKKE